MPSVATRLRPLQRILSFGSTLAFGSARDSRACGAPQPLGNVQLKNWGSSGMVKAGTPNKSFKADAAPLALRTYVSSARP
jgi:hypothetical protein